MGKIVIDYSNLKKTSTKINETSILEMELRNQNTASQILGKEGLTEEEIQERLNSVKSKNPFLKKTTTRIN